MILPCVFRVASRREVTRAGTTNLTYGHNDQHGMPWLQSWTNGLNPTIHVERDGLGTPLGLRIGTTDHAYVLDALGSVVAIVKTDGTAAATYTYDPYGNGLTATETGLGQTSIIRYAGGIHDPATNYTKYGQRWYNPIQGRFTQQDNLSFIGDPQQGNRYAYASSNPINFVDPTGLFSWSGLVYASAGAAFVGGVTGCLGTILAGCGAGLAVGVVTGAVGGALTYVIDQGKPE
ncbi:RHS repeat-associated core domain-containing protein [Micromonospora sp. NPDC000207]|uniref:RHS repeat-associated core domain-containing protein n=1 Tax=Micromonospora sp. NPDC000207 TaxID=3154246 RepID=UPI003325A173